MVAANPARDWRTLPANGRTVAAFDLKPDGLPVFDGGGESLPADRRGTLPNR